MRTLILLVVLVLIVLGIGAFLLGQEQGEISSALTVAEAMGGDTTGYRRAQVVRDLRFPEDYGPHPGYKTEWWYYTGNLETDGGRPFGYQFTIFRFALSPPEADTAARASGWATKQLYMGHLALTDGEDEAFFAFERFSRGGAGLAGARAEPYRVWLDDWSVEGGEAAFPARLQAREGDTGLDLRLDAVKPMVLQGDRGLDQKGPEPGNASYYYSFTRLATEGTVTVEGQPYAVRGLSWKDHEWSTSALSEDQVGWDWFSLQLSNGMDIMYYQLRRRDGTVSPYTNGTLVLPDGTTRGLEREEVTLEVLGRWESPRDGSRYPSGWRLQIPGEEVLLDITPLIADQELDVSVRYWEGAVRITGTVRGEAVAGKGYVELTGYGEGGEGGRQQSEG